MDISSPSLTSKQAETLIRREQNLRFINYCPACDKWMKPINTSLFECECGLERHATTPTYNHAYNK